jgi:hypothetical protein
MNSFIFLPIFLALFASLTVIAADLLSPAKNVAPTVEPSDQARASQKV